MIFFDNAATTFIKPSEVYRVLYENMVKIKVIKKREARYEKNKY